LALTTKFSVSNGTYFFNQQEVAYKARKMDFSFLVPLQIVISFDLVMLY